MISVEFGDDGSLVDGSEIDCKFGAIVALMTCGTTEYKLIVRIFFLYFLFSFRFYHC